MRHAASLALHRYWDTLRGGRPAPDLADVDPAALGALLPYTFVVDGPERASWLRLSGTRLDALFGRDLRGAPYRDLWSKPGAGRAERALAAARGGPAPVAAWARGAPVDRAPSDFEILLLPFRDSRRVLGSLAAAPVPGWSGLLAVGHLDLADFRVLGAAGARPDAAARPPARPRPIARFGHLRVYAGGRASEGPSSSARLNGSASLWRTP